MHRTQAVGQHDTKTLLLAMLVGVTVGVGWIGGILLTF